MEINLKLSNSEHKDLLAYCNLNDLLISSVVKDSFTTGFNIQKYGLLNTNVEIIEKEVIKEIIKYVEIPIVEEKEVVKIEYVEIEKIVEVPIEQKIFSTNEVIVEKIVEVPIEIIKEVEVIKEVEKPNEKMGMLQDTLMKLRREMGDKDKTITELNNKIEQLEKLVSNTGAVYMKGSNPVSYTHLTLPTKRIV